MQATSKNHAFNLFDNLIAIVRPADNMELANRINANLPVEPSIFFNEEIHDWLMGMGASFMDCGDGKTKYFLNYGKDLLRLIFFPEKKYETVLIDRLIENDDDNCGYQKFWDILGRFINPGTFTQFKMILSGYLLNLNNEFTTVS